MDILEAFVGVLVALIFKDFYDIFIKSHITKWFNNYKIMVMPKNGVIKGEKNDQKK